jgi:hypothetical protein
MAPLITTVLPWSTSANGDFDGDGQQDFAVATNFGDDITVYEPRPAGHFRSVRIPIIGAVVDLASGDFDGDGFDDLAIVTADIKTLTATPEHVQRARGRARGSAVLPDHRRAARRCRAQRRTRCL